MYDKVEKCNLPVGTKKSRYALRTHPGRTGPMHYEGPVKALVKRVDVQPGICPGCAPKICSGDIHAERSGCQFHGWDIK